MVNPSVSAIYDLVTAAIARSGLAPPATMIRTILLRDGRFVGEKYRFESGVAVWLAAERLVEVFDDTGKLLLSTPAAAEEARVA